MGTYICTPRRNERSKKSLRDCCCVLDVFFFFVGMNIRTEVWVLEGGRMEIAILFVLLVFGEWILVCLPLHAAVIMRPPPMD